MSLKPCIRRIRESGRTVKGWSIGNGFSYQTVVKLLHDKAGKRRIGISAQILEQLKIDGLYEEAAE